MYTIGGGGGEGHLISIGTAGGANAGNAGGGVEGGATSGLTLGLPGELGIDTGGGGGVTARGDSCGCLRLRPPLLLYALWMTSFQVGHIFCVCLVEKVTRRSNGFYLLGFNLRLFDAKMKSNIFPVSCWGSSSELVVVVVVAITSSW